MTTINRRDLARAALRAGAAIAAASPLSRFAIAAGKSRLIVIGGGAGGATVAAKVKATTPEVDVTLIDKSPGYTSCFFSNLYLGGFRTLESLTHDYAGLEKLGVNVVNALASGIDPDRRQVTLDDGTKLGFDRLVLSPGIDLKYETIEGYSPGAAQIMPHAWKAGKQTKILKDRLAAMRDGGVVVVAAPPNPYRCPPGPYERICMIAHYLKTQKPKSKLVLLDAKPSFSKQAPFMEAFDKHYKGIIEVHLSNDIDSQAVTRVNAKTGEVETAAGMKIKADVANIIPAQRAGAIVKSAGCAAGDWCPIVPDNFASTQVPGIHVIGDASIASQMPKSAFSANSQAKVVANDIAAALAGATRYPPRYRNTCWSMLAPDDSIKVGASYAPGTLAGKPALVASGNFVSKAGESPELRAKTNKESFGWYAGITTDIFAKG